MRLITRSGDGRVLQLRARMNSTRPRFRMENRIRYNKQDYIKLIPGPGWARFLRVKNIGLRSGDSSERSLNEEVAAFQSRYDSTGDFRKSSHIFL